MTSAKYMNFPYNQLIDYSDEGRLIGHIVMGVEMLDKKIDAIPDFPAQSGAGTAPYTFKPSWRI